MRIHPPDIVPIQQPVELSQSRCAATSAASICCVGPDDADNEPLVGSCWITSFAKTTRPSICSSCPRVHNAGASDRAAATFGSFVSAISQLGGGHCVHSIRWPSACTVQRTTAPFPGVALDSPAVPRRAPRRTCCVGGVLFACAVRCYTLVPRSLKGRPPHGAASRSPSWLPPISKRVGSFAHRESDGRPWFLDRLRSYTKRFALKGPWVP